MSTLIVIAKAPVAGRVKTRLCPPFTPGQAAVLAEAALRDTLDAVRATPCARRVLVLDGAPGPWLGDGFDVLPQRGAGLDERLAAAFEDAGGPALLIGMDTPQATPAELRAGLEALERAGAALGPAPDGGYWAIGLRCADRALFEGVPMSTPGTATAQLARLRGAGLSVEVLDELRDVDDPESARLAAMSAPHSRFAAALAGLDPARAAA